MEKQPKGKEFFIFLVTYILLLLLTVLLPIPFITVIFLPIPIILWVKAYEWKWIFIGLASILIISLLMFPLLSIPVSLLAIISGCMIGWALKHDQHPYEVWAKGTLGYVIGFVLIYVYLETFMDISISDMYTQTVEESMQMAREFMQAFGMNQFSDEDISAMRDQLLSVLSLMPVIFVSVSLFFAGMAQWFSYKLLNSRVQEKRYMFPPFRTFHLPKVILWIYFLTLMITLLSGLDESQTMMADMVMNVSNLAGILLILQGFSFIFHYTYVKQQSKALPIVSILIVVFFPFLGLYLVRILGIIDLGFGLKKIVDK
ncbi:hypothetical protein J416_13324 [Gracilibacillus halophilus YIM-C55.5]|uniref:DUF2232 domain-containing protein n=1 Tax=Gracilibacillus halophilus YIM-C55.5 TaxID=1308866 RepID=N4WS02_9BACI|nr:DUF2232 domain-containing protein [Gracilibacillus halophilus]ENH95961.1 hypothetical protein J416_13324 [Gracilibacillus halophilus YIM-C55.5]